MAQTPGEVITKWRNDPEKKEFVKQLYYDVDIWEAGLRFFASDEFQEVLQIARQHGKHKGIVLDVGGGNGVASLAWYHAGYSVVMLEPDESDIVGFAALYPVLESHNIETIQVHEGIAENTPFSDNHFDILYCRQVLHHITDLSQLMQEIRRVLKSDGIFIATREHVISKHSDLKIFLENHPIHRYTGGEHSYLESEYVQALNSIFSQVTVLRYYDSVINYSPVSKDEFDHIIKKGLCRIQLLRQLHLCGILSHIGFLRSWTITRLNQTNDYPGRMYSFIAHTL